MKRLVKASILFVAVLGLMTSCGCYNKMLKKLDTVEVKSSPEILTLRGSNVTADVTVTFPARYFNPRAVLKITPVLVYPGGEIEGTPKFVQGDKVTDNYTVISKRHGGSYTQTVSIPFTEQARLSTLELRVEARCSKGCNSSEDYTPVGTIVVAQGVNTIQNSANLGAALQIMPDNFKRVTTITQEADIHYVINRSDVRKSELTTEQIKMFEDFVREYYGKDRATLGNIYAKGYASPEGPLDFNDKLSKARSISGEEAISNQLKDVNVKYDIAAYGEDWDGFKRLVEQSNIKDKDLILQVLQMYSSPAQRERELRNMSSVFNVLAEEILPQLRRTQFTANADIEGRTDRELITAAQRNPRDLTLEEALYAATLLDNNADKAKVYAATAERYNDVRAYNNLGVVLARDGKLSEARTALNRAASIKSAPEISNNLGIVALMQGNVDEAQRYLATADRQSQALLHLAKGNHVEATRGLSGYNLAVAEAANGNFSAAKTALGNDASAEADYLRAVIASRQNDMNGAIANLRSAISKDSSLRAKAQSDVNFARLFGTSEFNSL